jgi:hypothetical protein
MWLVYTRERKHIGTKWPRVTCLPIPLAAQNPARQTLGGSQSPQRLTIAIGNRQYKQINKKYTKQYLMPKQIVPKGSTHRYKHVSARIN